MTNDTVKQALRDLFPDPEPIVEEPVVEEAAEGEEKKKTGQEKGSATGQWCYRT